MVGTYMQKCWKAYTTDIHHRTEILRSTAAADVGRADCWINSLSSDAERVQLYLAVQDVTIPAKDTLTRMFARKHKVQQGHRNGPKKLDSFFRVFKCTVVSGARLSSP